MAMKPLKSIKWPDLPDRYWVVQADGSYQQMTVGNAEQLVATVGIEDKVPYNFRTSGGANDIGDREVDKIIGGTVAWNQLVIPIASTQGNGITITNNGDGSISVSGKADNNGYVPVISSALSLNTEHVYLFDLHTALTTGQYWYIGEGNTWIRRSAFVLKPTSAFASGFIRFNVIAEETYDIKVIPQLFDLTQMFGSTIADYIYTLETGTAGAGVAFFRSLFPAPYYAYNTGELMHVQTSAHKMVGFNAWDEEWELGDIDGTTGQNTSNSSLIRAKNYIRVIPDTQYYFEVGDTAFTSNIRARFYDADKNYIGAYAKDASTVYPRSTFTIPTNCHYMRFAMQSGYGTTYKNDICINLHWDGERDGEYEPYEEHTYPLDSDLVLRGIPKLDANNSLYYDGDEYASDGTVTRKYGYYQATGNEQIVAWGSGWLITLPTKGYFRNIDVNTYMVSDIMTPEASGAIYAGTTAYSKACCVTNSGDMGLYISGVTTTQDLQTWLSTNKPTFVYELATQTTEEADPYQNPQVVNDWGTEEYVDSRTVPIPVGHDTMYRANLRAKLEMLPNSPDSNGDYIVRHLNGVNTFVELIKELPTAPTTDGTYHLKCTVASGTATLTWEEDQA